MSPRRTAAPRCGVLPLVTLLVACNRPSPDAVTTPMAAPSAPAARPSASAPVASASAQGLGGRPRSIGVARMRPDGTLELDLRGPGGAEARLVYPPTHAKYTATLAHLGGLKPGEEKAVPPWPDPWDEGKVLAAANAHAAKKGWGKGDYRPEITGTDADGHAAVTLHHVADARLDRPGGGKSVALRIETRGYTVVRELHFQ